MANNVINAVFSSSNITYTKPAYQYDYGMILKFSGIELPQAYEVHFSNKEFCGESISQIGDADGVTIPDEMFLSGAPIYAWTYLHTGEDDGETIYKTVISINKRAQPSDIEPTPVQQDVITQAIAALNTAVEQTAADVVASGENAQAAANSATEASGYAEEAKGYAERAESAESEAEGYATRAETAESHAQGYAQTASDKASEASGYASDAQGYADSASSSASDAQGYANDAKGYSESASASASDASGYASSAEGSAQSASGSASDASSAKDLAVQAKDDAVSAKNSAEGFSSDAQGYAESAQESAQDAEESAQSVLGLTADATIDSNVGTPSVDVEVTTESDHKNMSFAFHNLKGVQGDPGISPTITVKEISGGHEVEVVDAQGTQTFDVMDGLYRASKMYGVRGVGGQSHTLTRLWDAVGKTATPGTDLVQCVSDFDELAPFNRRKCVGYWTVDPDDQYKALFHVNAYVGDADYKEDGSMGDYVAVEVEPFWYIKDDLQQIWGVSPEAQTGWSVHPICIDAAGNVRPKTYIPAYNLAIKDGHAVSLPGYDPFFGDYKQNQDSARTYGEGSFIPGMIETCALQDYEELLVTIEFASTDAQDDYIMGATNMLYANTYKSQLDTTDENYVIVTSAGGDAFVVGQTIFLGTTYSDTPSASAMASAYNHITSIDKCDADGTLNPNGTFAKITFDGTARSTTSGTTTISSRPWITGTTDGHATGVPKVLGHTGSPISNSTGKYPFRYRWRENIWGNINRTLHDLINTRVEDGSSYHLDWYFLAEPSKYTPKNVGASDLTSANGWAKLGVTTPVESYADGYIKAFGHDSTYPFVRVPVLTKNGSSTTYYSDYAYLVSSNAVRAVRVGGDLFSGARAAFGLFYRLANSAPSSRYWYSGSALFMMQ